MATLFTSLYPSQHGLLSHPDFRHITQGAAAARPIQADVLPERLVTLAELLRGAGHRTAAFVANPWLGAELGFAQGFQVYDDSFASWNAPGREVSVRGLEWLEGVRAGEPYFLFLHYMDAHRPYPPLSLDEIASQDVDDRALSETANRAIERVVQLEGGVGLGRAGVPPSLGLLELAYDKGVSRFDDALGHFLAGLARRADARDTVVIVTSDHGESLFHRGFGNHGRSLYEDEVAVPLAMRMPGVGARESRISCSVGLIDLLPTLCTYLGLDCPEPIFGSSLLDRADAPGRFLVSEGVGGAPRHRAIRNRSYKLIYQPTGRPDGRETGSPYSLYRIDRDPVEALDLIEAETGEAGRALDALSQALGQAVADFDAPPVDRIPLEEDLEERLRALGYLEGEGP